jgi:predicted ferric reductase
MTCASVLKEETQNKKEENLAISPARTAISSTTTEIHFDRKPLSPFDINTSYETRNPTSDVRDDNAILVDEFDSSNVNLPHPSLEFIPFYCLIQQCPIVLGLTRLVYRLRWSMSYPLQHNMCLTRILSKIGIYATFGEAFLAIPLVGLAIGGVIYTAFHPSVQKSGQMSRLLVLSAFFLAQRNSYVTFLLGLPVDRAIFYHKASGRLALLIGILHTLTFVLDPYQRHVHSKDIIYGAFSGAKCVSGSVLLILLLVLTMSTLPWIRKNLFEFWYVVHLVCIGGIVVGAFYHSGIMVPILVLVSWGFDVFFRSVVMARIRNPRQANVATISDSVTVICISKTKTFSYNPGQYVYIAIPAISWTQWHPFSIASAPNDDTVKLYVRKAGNWTSALFELARSKTTIDVFIEGPYGSLKVDVMGNHEYKSMLLISGGIGGKILLNEVKSNAYNLIA